MKLKFLLCSLAAFVLLSGCSKTKEETPIPIVVSEVQLSDRTLSMVAGETSQLTAKVIPDNAEYNGVEWLSSNPAAVTVDKTGLVTAVTAGDAKITATAGGITATCVVEVRNKIPNVYIAGYYDRLIYAFCWKTGDKELTMLGTLDQSTEAYTVVVSADEDVYIGGRATTDDRGYFAPTLWKNGETKFLTDPAAPIDGAVNSISIDGSDVYGGGYYRVNRTETTPFKKDVATIWKNDTQIELTEGKNYAQVRSICVSGGTVYAVGEATNTDGNAVATLWANTGDDWSAKTSKNLSDGVNQAYAQSVAVSGSDVYVAGYGYKSPTQKFYSAMLWKNDAPVQYLSDVESWAYSVCVANGHVYVAGWEYKTYNGKPCAVATLWVDGVAQALTTEQMSSQARCVFVAGDVVYVSGFLGNQAVIWENGKAGALTDGANTAAISSIFVTLK